MKEKISHYFVAARKRYLPRKAVSTKEIEVGVSETMPAAKLSTHQR